MPKVTGNRLQSLSDRERERERERERNILIVDAHQSNAEISKVLEFCLRKTRSRKMSCHLFGKELLIRLILSLLFRCLFRYVCPPFPLMLRTSFGF